MATITASVRATADAMTLRTLFLGPLLVGSALIFWILFLHVFVCGDALGRIGIRADGTRTDVVLGLLLAGGTLVLHFGFGEFVRPLFPRRPPAAPMMELFGSVARDPWLLALWLGPVVWIGVALFEELARCVLLRRLWIMTAGEAGRWGSLILVSVLFGLAHSYQGPASVLSISLKSFVVGYAYMRTGRFGALVIAHALYDSVQIVMAVVAVRGAGG